MNIRALITAVTTSIATNLATAGVLYDWQFNEANGTAANSISPSFTSAATGINTDGNGNLLVDNSAAANLFLGTSGGSATALNYTTGTYYLDIDISSWSLTSGNGTLGGTGSGLYVGFMNDANTSVATDINITTNGSNVYVQSRTATTNNYNTTTSVFATSGSDLLLRLVVDADNSTSSLLFSTNGGGDFTSISSSVSFAGRGLNYFRFRQSADWSGANNITIDSMTISSVPEPAAYASLLGLGFLGLVVTRRRR